MEHWRNNTDMENRRTQTRACSTAISSTTNLTQSDTVMNSGLREGRRVIEDRPTFSYIIYTKFVPHREQCVTSRRTSRLILVTARITRYTKTDCVGKLQRFCVLRAGRAYCYRRTLYGARTLHVNKTEQRRAPITATFSVPTSRI